MMDKTIIGHSVTEEKTQYVQIMKTYNCIFGRYLEAVLCILFPLLYVFLHDPMHVIIIIFKSEVLANAILYIRKDIQGLPKKKETF